MEELKSSGWGCYLNNEFVGALGYADDVTLIATSKFETEKMLEICSNFAARYNIIFNPGKTSLLVYDDIPFTDSIVFLGKAIYPSQKCKLLGQVLAGSFCQIDISPVINEYSSKAIAVFSSFKYLDCILKIK